MGLSAQVTAFVSPLLRWPVQEFEAAVGRSHRHSDKTLYRVRMAGWFRSERLLAGSEDRSLGVAVAKTLSEFGECLLSVHLGVTHRSGMAGGIFRSGVAARASNELLERDAFFFHYRSQVPFLSVHVLQVGLLAFELSCAGKAHVFLVTDSDTAEGKSDCLILGTGSGSSSAIAINNALREYRALKHHHENRPGRCSELSMWDRDQLNVCDLHHVRSRDDRNRATFKALCRTKPFKTERPSGSFSFEWFESPIRGFQFCRASNPALQSIEFGVPEKTEDGAEPLYHPFW